MESNEASDCAGKKSYFDVLVLLQYGYENTKISSATTAVQLDICSTYSLQVTQADFKNSCYSLTAEKFEDFGIKRALLGAQKFVESFS